MDAREVVNAINKNIDNNKGFKDVDVCIHLGGGVILGIDDIGTDGEGNIYIDCNGEEYINMIKGTNRVKDNQKDTMSVIKDAEK